jgi:hypothetical protein
MPGLKRTYTELYDLIEQLVDTPFSFLAAEKQALISKNLSTIFSNILVSLKKEDLEKTVFYSHVEGLESSLKNGLDEQKFAQHLKPFLEALNANERSHSYEVVSPVVKKFLDRVLPFMASESQAKKYRDTHTINEVHNHDTEIIRKSMQLYALDYFLFMYKNICISEDKKNVIFSGIQKAPSLASDALDDDMLKKVVFSLHGKNVRKRMIHDYYTYKQAFLPTFNDAALTSQKISEITEALRAYCLSLIEVSLEYGVVSLEYALFESYKPNTALVEIKKQLTNA